MKPSKTSDSQSDIRFDQDGREHLFAAFLGLTLLMLLARLEILHSSPNSSPYLPLLAYQDIFVCVFLAWLFEGLLAFSRPSWLRRT
jgi:hypothetical protein